MLTSNEAGLSLCLFLFLRSRAIELIQVANAHVAEAAALSEEHWSGADSHTRLVGHFCLLPKSSTCEPTGSVGEARKLRAAPQGHRLSGESRPRRRRSIIPLTPNDDEAK
jgi:hypothetical protein